MLSQLNTFDLWLSLSLLQIGRYAFMALIAWLLAYRLFRSRWFHRKIIQAWPGWRDISREMRYSLSSALIFGCVGTLTLKAAKLGWTQMYFDFDTHGPWWFALSILLTILLHDAYFYWTHRWMHQPKVFRWMHRVHHQSHNPTPWASFAFSPWEALVQAGIFPLTALLFPIHPVAFGAFMSWQLLNNILGHTGFEIYPAWLIRSPFGLIFNTPTNHVMHHEKPNGNYGIYFNWWDRLMGTNHVDYEDRLAELTRPVGKTVR